MTSTPEWNEVWGSDGGLAVKRCALCPSGSLRVTPPFAVVVGIG